jgi:hypothetical protein
MPRQHVGGAQESLEDESSLTLRQFRAEFEQMRSQLAADPTGNRVNSAIPANSK